MKATHTVKIGDKYYYVGEELPKIEDETSKRKKTTKTTEKQE